MTKSKDGIDGVEKGREFRDSEVFFRGILNSIQDAVVAFNEQGIIVLFNPSAERIFGYTAGEVMGQKIDMLMPYPFFLEKDACIYDCFKTGKVKMIDYGFELQGRRKDGAIFPMEILYSEVWGKILPESPQLPVITAPKVWESEHVFICTIRDITELRLTTALLRENKERFQNISDNANDAIICMKSCGGIYLWNKKAETMFGYPANEVIGRDLHALIVPERYREKAREGLKAFSQTGVGPVIGKTLELSALRKDGSEFPIELSVSAMRTCEGWEATAIIRDITERKQAEEKINKVNAFLVSIRNVNNTLLLVKDEHTLFNKICDAIVKIGFVKFAWIGIIEKETSEVVPVAQEGFGEGFLSSIKINLKDPASHIDPVGMAIHMGEPIDMWDIEKDSILEPWRDASVERGYASSVAVPLKHRGEVVGVLSVYSDKTHAFGKEEIGYLVEVANDVAVGIKSLWLEQELQKSVLDLRKMLNGTIEAVSLMTEVRDPYTSGHQRRVAQLSCAVVKEMGMPDRQIEGIRISALLHDIGKIIVPSDILSKPGMLNKYECGIIHEHPQVGYDILKGLEFPWPVAMAILQHHERLDGSGYPTGLKGDDIIPDARILSVVDVVEAMMNHRPYRPALGIDAALDEITRNKGVLYDDKVVDACLKLFKEKGFKFE